MVLHKSTVLVVGILSVSDLIVYTTIPSYLGFDILLKPPLINIYLSQSIITVHKLQRGCMKHIYKLYPIEHFEVPTKIIYSNLFIFKDLFSRLK
jgi:hypothetical protein